MKKMRDTLHRNCKSIQLYEMKYNTLHIVKTRDGKLESNGAQL